MSILTAGLDLRDRHADSEIAFHLTVRQFHIGQDALIADVVVTNKSAQPYTVSGFAFELLGEDGQAAARIENAPVTEMKFPDEAHHHMTVLSYARTHHFEGAGIQRTRAFPEMAYLSEAEAMSGVVLFPLGARLKEESWSGAQVRLIVAGYESDVAQQVI